MVKKELQRLKNKTAMSVEQSARDNAAREEEMKEQHILALEEMAAMSRQQTIATKEMGKQVAHSAGAANSVIQAILDMKDTLDEFVNVMQGIVSLLCR